MGLYHNRIYDTNKYEQVNLLKRLLRHHSTVKKTRVDADLSQQAVVDKLGKPQSYISKIESGERQLDVSEMKKFVVIYKKPVDYFLK